MSRLFNRQTRRDQIAERAQTIHATISGLPDRRRTSRGAGTIVVLEPQLLPGERITAAERTMAERALRERLRADDHFWANSDGSFFVVLTNCSGDNARVVAHRIGVEVTLRANSVRSRNWIAAVAGYPTERAARQETAPFTAAPSSFSLAM